MATNQAVQIDNAAIMRLAKSGEVMAELDKRARKVAAVARSKTREDMVVDVSRFVGSRRARVTVMAPFGLREDRKTAFLHGSIDAARG